MNDIPKNCGTCKFWQSGECWRYPPTPLIDSDDRYRYERPAVRHEEFCGEWREREGVR